MKAALGVIAAAVVLTSGCAQKDWIDRALVTVDVTGVWEGRLIMPEASWSGDFVCDRPIATEASPAGNVALVLQQQGGKVTGEISNLSAGSVTSTGSTSIQGTVEAAMLGLHDVSRRTFRSILQVNGDEITGLGVWFDVVYEVSLHRQSIGSPPP